MLTLSLFLMNLVFGDRFCFKVSTFCFSPIESKRKIQIVHEHLENKNTDGLRQHPDGRGQTDVAQTRTGSRHMMNTGSNERNSITGFNEKSGICQTEIDLSSSCIELIVHRWVIYVVSETMSHRVWVIIYKSQITFDMFRNDGTIRRKKYRDHPR